MIHCFLDIRKSFTLLLNPVQRRQKNSYEIRKSGNSTVLVVGEFRDITFSRKLFTFRDTETFLTDFFSFPYVWIEPLNTFL